MSTKKYRDHQSLGQSFLLPPSPRDWLPPDHLAFFVVDVVDQLDLSAIEDVIHAKDPRGERPYSPRVLTAVLLYSYARGVFSSRKIERATYEDVGTRVVAGETHPDHSTLARFRKTFQAELSGLFVQVLALCQEAGLVRLGRVAIDGTRVQAYASKHKAMSYEYMKKKLEKLEEEVRSLMQMADEADRLEDAEQGDENLLLNHIPAELSRRQDRIKLIKETMKRLEAEARDARVAELEEQAARQDEKAEDPSLSDGKRSMAKKLASNRREKAGAIRDGDDDGPPSTGATNDSRQGALFPTQSEAPESQDQENRLPEHVIRHYADGSVHPRAQHNFTDADSRIMEHQGGFLQAYNGQVVATEQQIIVAQGLSNAAPDAYYLQPLIDDVAQHCGTFPEVALADAGYWSPANAEYLEQRGVDGYIATGRECYELAESTGSDPPETPRAAMRAKVQDPEGRDRYRARKWMVEPVFGQIKGAIGFRQLLRRGLAAAQAEWALLCTVHNMLKLWRAGAPTPSG